MGNNFWIIPLKEEEQLHLNVGLNKIAETVGQVEEMQKSLAVKSAELQAKNDMANAKLKQMVSTNQLKFCFYWVPDVEKIGNERFEIRSHKKLKRWPSTRAYVVSGTGLGRALSST